MATHQPRMLDPPPPALELIDLDECLTDVRVRFAQLTDQCSNNSNLDHYIEEAGWFLGLDADIVGARSPKHRLHNVGKQARFSLCLTIRITIRLAILIEILLAIRLAIVSRIQIDHAWYNGNLSNNHNQPRTHSIHIASDFRGGQNLIYLSHNSIRKFPNLILVAKTPYGVSSLVWPSPSL